MSARRGVLNLFFLLSFTKVIREDASDSRWLLVCNKTTVIQGFATSPLLSSWFVPAFQLPVQYGFLLVERGARLLSQTVPAAIAGHL